MQSSIVLSIVVACGIIVVASLICGIMCLTLRRKTREAKADEESTLSSFPVSVRKLTIERGQVVTAPPSPGMMSLTRFPRWPASMYSSSKRTSRVGTAPDVRASFYDASSKRTSTQDPVDGAPAGAASPTSGEPSHRDDEKHYIAEAELLEEKTWQHSVLVESPQNEKVDVEKGLEGDRTARKAKTPSSENGSNILMPDAALISPKSSMTSPNKRASLGALSQAAASIPEEPEKESPRNSADAQTTQRAGSVSSWRAHSTRSRHSQASSTISRSKSSPHIASTPTGEVTRSPVHPSHAASSSDAPRKSPRSGRKQRPPPITTSRAPPKIPHSFLKSPTDSIATVGDDVHLALPRTESPTPSDQSGSHRTMRQSIFSVTSSQYSPTASIRPVDKVQIMSPPSHPQRVLTRSATTSPGGPPVSALPSNVKMMSPFSPPATAASADPVLSEGYSMSPTAMESSSNIITAALTKQGFDINGGSGRGAKRAPPPPPLPPVRGPHEGPRSAGSYDVPLTSASISFPPNLPDFSYSPRAGGHGERKHSCAGLMHDEFTECRHHAPQGVGAGGGTGSMSRPQLLARSHTVANSRNLAAEPPTTASAAVSGDNVAVPTVLPRAAVPTMRDLGLRGTASVSISELAGMAELERSRKNVKVPKKPKKRGTN